jgi:hypothetical protein
MTETYQIPVLLLIFNRPDLTSRVFERIRQARPGKLFIAADGPRLDRENEPQSCAETRKVVEVIDWPCEVRRLYRDTNLGCMLAVSSAISWFFDHVEEGIILEDDCLPHPSFFPYCQELLNRYRLEPRVAMIGSNNIQPPRYRRARGTSYYFSKYPQIWGWATWRRTWQNYDVTLADWNGDQNALDRISNCRARRRLAKRFDHIKAGTLDSWAYQLVHQCLRYDCISISPSVNLVENIGFDDRATHTQPSSSVPHPQARPMDFPLIHPPSLAVDEKADLHTETWVQGAPHDVLSSLALSLQKRVRKFRSLLFTP